MTPERSAAEIKQCCAAAYGSDVARSLFGESLHPGGIALTLELAGSLGIRATSRVLDVAAGRGASAIAIAERFGCSVVGLDLSVRNVDEARALSRERGLADRVRFEVGDAELLPLADESFDALICECAFCTFPAKDRAASEFARVLRPNGRIGLSDLTRAPAAGLALDDLASWVACIGDARPAEDYAALLAASGFAVTTVARRDDALRELVERVRARLVVAKILTGSEQWERAGIRLDTAKAMAADAARAVRAGTLGYALIVGEKRCPPNAA